MTRLAGIIIAAAAFAASSCTPAQVAWWNDPTVPQETKDHVADELRRAGVCPFECASMGEDVAASADCYTAVDRHWPAGSRAWARAVVWRESRNTPTAQNARSSAAGCFQLLRLHAHRVPGGWGNRYDADANALAALSLYREAGASPWSL